MSKYTPLWQKIQNDNRSSFTLTFSEIQNLAGIPIDHSFLTFKKELLSFGYEVSKISLKNHTVTFNKLEKNHND